MAWGLYRNLEASLVDFLTTKKTTDGLTVDIRVGRKEASWTLPCISLYHDKTTQPRGFVGSNQRLETYLMIIDIFATNEAERLDLARWLEVAINDGCTYYTYTSSESTPNSPTKVAGGLINVDFVTNTRVGLGQNVNLEDAHRHRISINVWLSGS